MRFIATIIIVLLSFCSITAVQAEQSNSCKQCREQQQACCKKLFCKDMQDRIRYLHERMPEKITRSVSREPPMGMTALKYADWVRQSSLTLAILALV
jgi:hypothetical protein